MAGERFGRLLVIERDGSIRKAAAWVCLCDCGTRTRVVGNLLRRGRTTSCGCRATELRNQFGKTPAAENLIGMNFGRLLVVERVGRQWGFATWKCACECGRTSTVTSRNLKAGKTASCGCLRRESIAKVGRSTLLDLTGRRFGRLLVIARSGSTKQGAASWICRCDCGTTKIISGASLKSKSPTASCGCLALEVFETTRRSPRERLGLPAYSREEQRIANATLNAKYRAELRDSYVAQLLEMRTAEAPKYLIQMKREQINLRRMALLLRKAQDEGSEDTR